MRRRWDHGVGLWKYMYAIRETLFTIIRFKLCISVPLHPSIDGIIITRLTKGLSKGTAIELVLKSKTSKQQVQFSSSQDLKFREFLKVIRFSPRIFFQRHM